MTTTTNIGRTVARRRAALTAGSLVVPVLALLVAACGADGGGEGNGGGDSRTGAGPRAEADRERPGDGEQRRSPSPSPTPTPASTPTPEEPERPQKAADGRNLDACRDRRCQVEARSGDLIGFDPPYDSEMFAVVDVSADGLVFSSSSGMQGTLAGDGSVETGDVRIDVLTTDQGKVILTIRPR